MTYPDWVDEYLLGGKNDDCIVLGEPLPRGTLRAQVADRAAELRSAGLGPGETISLRLPPSLAYVVNLLAAWRLGAQVSLLDHRLTPYEVDKVLTRIAPQFVVSAPGISGRRPRTYADVQAATTPYPGHPARTGHALLQLSSGSTGTPKIIGRTADGIVAEIDRYAQIDGTPREGERIILLASMVHVLGLVGGLLYGLRAGARLVLPRSLTPDAVLDAITGDGSPATVLGVPFHLRLLLTADPPVGGLPQLKRVTVAGEPTSPQERDAFASRYQVPLGNMYGMTEAGVIATDLSGQHYPAVRAAPGMTLRAESGQLLLASPAYWMTRYMVVGGNFAARRSALEQIGGFDTEIAFYGEDTNIARRLHAAGKVKFSLRLPMRTSSRRLQEEGMTVMAGKYVANFLSEVVLKRPVTRAYRDIR